MTFETLFKDKKVTGWVRACQLKLLIGTSENEPELAVRVGL